MSARGNRLHASWWLRDSTRVASSASPHGEKEEQRRPAGRIRTGRSASRAPLARGAPLRERATLRALIRKSSAEYRRRGKAGEIC